MSCMNVVILPRVGREEYWLENNSRRVNKDIHLCCRCLNCIVNWWICYLDYKYVTARKAGNYLLARKRTWRGWDNWWWSQDIDSGWFDTLPGQCASCVCIVCVRPTVVECDVSVRSGALRSGQLGSSKRCTFWWIVRHFISDHLLAVLWRLHARSNTPHEPGQPRARVYQLHNIKVENKTASRRY